MARIVYNEPVKEVHGAIEKKGIVTRRKTYRDEKGRIIHEATPEAYNIRHPRDWKKNPPKGEELRKINRFKEACSLTKNILLADDPNTNPSEEQILALQSYRERFISQLGKKADPEAPCDPKTGKPKRYFRLDNFIRALIYKSLKTAESTQQN